jgi:hypothetical protein
MASAGLLLPKNNLPMVKKFSIETIQNEIDKITHPTELASAYHDIKNYMAKKLKEHQQRHESIANQIQVDIDKINGN